jgi:putative phage-type endonuclease
MLDPRRKERICGSEIAKICGLSPFGGPHDVFLEKAGMVPSGKESTAMSRGKRMERYIIDMLREDLKRPINWNKDEILSLGIHPLVAATPDGIAVEYAESPTAVVEVKSPGIRAASDWDDDVPLYYLAQIQWEMASMSLANAIVGAWLPDEGLRIIHKRFDEEFFCTLLKEAERFWRDHVMTGIPPPNPSADFVKQWYRHTGEKTIIDEGIGEKAKRLSIVKKKLKRIEEEKEVLEIQVKMAIGNDSGVEGSWGKATWKERKGAAKISWEGLAKSFKPTEQQIDDFTTIVPGGRVFLLRVKEENP